RRRAARGGDRRIRRLPDRRRARGGRPRLPRRDDPEGVGRRRPRLRQLRAGRRGHRARERHRGRGAVGIELARRAADRAVLSLAAELIGQFGRAPQKERWLRRLARGEAIGAFALSEIDAGTDAANQHAKAVRSGEGYRITGRKVWVANAEAAAVVVVFAATRPGLRSQGVAAFLVPMDTPGINRRARNDSLGVRGLGCMDLDFDVTVEDDAVIGPVDQGFPLAMWALEGGRIAIAAQALGIGEAALDEALAYAKTRETFGQPIATYQAVQWMLADASTELAAARMLTFKAAAAKGRQEKVGCEA